MTESQSIRARNKEKKRMNCLRCRKPFLTDVCHRICSRCHESVESTCSARVVPSDALMPNRPWRSVFSACILIFALVVPGCSFGKAARVMDYSAQTFYHTALPAVQAAIARHQAIDPNSEVVKKLRNAESALLEIAPVYEKVREAYIAIELYLK